MRGIPSLNSVFADYAGNIFYLYNGNIPVRKSGFDWKNYLPGWTSETLWDEIIPFSKLPMVQNPASGLLYSTNQSPLYVSEDSDNLKLESLPIHGGIELTQNNRSLRASELFSPKTILTFEEFKNIKYDMYYSQQSAAARHIEDILNAINDEDSLLQKSKSILKKWNLGTYPTNKEAALGMLTLTPFLKWTYQKIEKPMLLKYVRTASKQLMETHGTISIPYGKVHRLIRGKQDLEIGGGPDILHAVYASNYAPGKMKGFAGDGLIYLVKWDSTGTVFSQSIHQYGSATSRPDSPHYSDQSALFARREMKPVWRTKTEILQNLESSYKPGEEIKN
jgi:penicillin amidase/acyl-homoserine-lactone acylase